MSKLITLGAINKQTNTYETPYYASKKNKYICPDCDKQVILRKGNINRHHFAHQSNENTCNYYDKPSESQIHKDCKLLLKFLIKRHKDIEIYRKCILCNSNDKIYNIIFDEEKHKIKKEFGFKYQKHQRYADVALIDKKTSDLVSIFEVFYKHKTDAEVRPDPWCELNAVQILNTIFDDMKKIIFNCERRDHYCDTCLKKKICMNGFGDYYIIWKLIMCSKNINEIYFEWCKLLCFNGSLNSIVGKYNNVYTIDENNEDVTNGCLTNRNMKQIKKLINRMNGKRKMKYNMKGSNIFSGKDVQFDVKLIKKIMSWNIIDIIEKVWIYKGECEIKFNDKIDNYSKNETYKMLFTLFKFWTIIIGENYDDITCTLNNGKCTVFKNKIQHIKPNIYYK